MSLETRPRWNLPIAVPSPVAWGGLVSLELFVLAFYFAIDPAEIRSIRYLLYPFVWINVGVWAVVRTGPVPASLRHRLVGMGVGTGYFLVVMAVPGNIALGELGTQLAARVGWYAPGWGPLVAVSGPLRLYLIPFEVIGYAALAYLVYVATLDLVRTALPGVLGLVTCVGCTVPVLAPIVGLLGGPASGSVTTAYAYSYDIGTVVFVVTVVLMTLSREWLRDPKSAI